MLDLRSTRGKIRQGLLVKIRIPERGRVAVLRALKLGDFLVAIPAVRALKHAFRDATIEYIGLPGTAPLAQRFSHLFSGLIEFPGWPALPERSVDLARIPAFLREMQERRFDLAIQLHGSGSHVNDLVCLFGARQIAGYYERGSWCPDPQTFMLYPESDPEIWRHLRLLQFLGIQPRGEQLEFPLGPADYRELGLLCPELDGNAPYVVIHAGAAANRERLWPLEHVATVADALSAWGFKAVFTGTAPERTLVTSVMGRMKHPAIDLSGKTSFGALGALISGAQLLICNDTGVSHIAAALETPSVVVFDRSEREGWPPLNRQLHRFLSRFGGVAPAEVIAQAGDVLQWSAQIGRARSPLPACEAERCSD